MEAVHGEVGSLVTASRTGFVPGTTSVAVDHAVVVGPGRVAADAAGITATFTLSLAWTG